MIYRDKYQSPLGTITLSSDGERLTGLWFDRRQSSEAASLGAQRLNVFEQAKAWLDCYFKGENPSFTPPLLLKGTPFRRDVWEAVLKIPYGTTCTYGDISDKLISSNKYSAMSAQAVGGALGHNPILIIVPCHRVIGNSGKPVGYSGGIERKSELLKLEKTEVKGLLVKK